MLRPIYDRGFLVQAGKSDESLSRIDIEIAQAEHVYKYEHPKPEPFECLEWILERVDQQTADGRVRLLKYAGVVVDHTALYREILKRLLSLVDICPSIYREFGNLNGSEKPEIPLERIKAWCKLALSPSGFVEPDELSETETPPADHKPDTSSPPYSVADVLGIFDRSAGTITRWCQEARAAGHRWCWLEDGEWRISPDAPFPSTWPKRAAAKTPPQTKVWTCHTFKCGENIESPKKPVKCPACGEPGNIVLNRDATNALRRQRTNAHDAHD